MSVDLSGLPNGGLVVGKNGVADVACKLKSVNGAIRIMMGFANNELPKWANDIFYSRVLDMMQNYHPEMDAQGCERKISEEVNSLISLENQAFRRLLNRTYERLSLPISSNVLIHRNK
ncbi:MAG: hypothetical protein K5912_01900 [Alphaproteobacteria bacterium]|nr:hypothetical protein [Alphaproteobacteria bacterium]